MGEIGRITRAVFFCGDKNNQGRFRAFSFYSTRLSPCACRNSFQILCMTSLLA